MLVETAQIRVPVNYPILKLQVDHNFPEADRTQNEWFSVLLVSCIHQALVLLAVRHPKNVTHFLARLLQKPVLCQLRVH